jgi:hypothetical protein
MREEKRFFFTLTFSALEFNENVIFLSIDVCKHNLTFQSFNDLRHTAAPFLLFYLRSHNLLPHVIDFFPVPSRLMKLMFSAIRNLHVSTCGKFINHAHRMWNGFFYIDQKSIPDGLLSRTIISMRYEKKLIENIKLNDIVSQDDEQFCLLCAELRSNWSEAK